MVNMYTAFIVLYLANRQFYMYEKISKPKKANKLKNKQPLFIYRYVWKTTINLYKERGKLERISNPFHMTIQYGTTFRRIYILCSLQQNFRFRKKGR